MYVAKFGADLGPDKRYMHEKYCTHFVGKKGYTENQAVTSAEKVKNKVNRP